MAKRMVKRSGRPVLKTSEAGKDKILKAFISIAYDEGVEAITLQKVSDRSGLAMNTVRYHFKNRGVTLTQVAIDFVAEKNYEFIEKKMREDRTQKDFNPVLSYADSQFDWIESEPVQACILFYYFFATTTRIPLKIDNTELMTIAIERLETFIKEGMKLGIYKPSTDLKKLSAELYMIIAGACLSLATSRHVEYRKNVVINCKNLLNRLL